MHRFILAIILSASVFPLAAQTDRATLTGVVTSRSVVPGANVNLKAAATGIEYLGTPRQMQFMLRLSF